MGVPGNAWSHLTEEAMSIDLQQLAAGVPVPQANAQLVREGLAQRGLSGARRAMKQNHSGRQR